MERECENSGGTSGGPGSTTVSRDPAGKLLRGERGQGTTEYIILIVLVALVCIPVVKWLPEAVRGYVRPFYYCLSRPIP